MRAYQTCHFLHSVVRVKREAGAPYVLSSVRLWRDDLSHCLLNTYAKRLPRWSLSNRPSITGSWLRAPGHVRLIVPHVVQRRALRQQRNIFESLPRVRADPLYNRGTYGHQAQTPMASGSERKQTKPPASSAESMEQFCNNFKTPYECFVVLLRCAEKRGFWTGRRKLKGPPATCSADESVCVNW
jgi:hypothetical protein